MAKLALQGLSNINMARVTENSTARYTKNVSFPVPYAQSMKRTQSSEQKTIYSDDDVYMSISSDKGTKISIELAQADLPLMAKLGIGMLNVTTGELAPFPTIQNNEYFLSFAVQQEQGYYRMYKLYSVTILSFEENDIKTKGNGADISSYTLTVMRKKRELDGNFGVVKDGTTADLAWLLG